MVQSQLFADDEITPDLVCSIRYPTAKEEYIHPELPHWLIQVFTKISLLFGK